MKDYYKILGVPRSATQREIKKAFRQQAQVYTFSCNHIHVRSLIFDSVY